MLSNLVKFKDLYGDLSDYKIDYVGIGIGYSKDSGVEEVIKLGGFSWK